MTSGRAWLESPIVPLAFYAAALAFNFGVLGRSIRFEPALFQFLDVEALRRSPATSLLLQHGQPPLLNATLAAALRASDGVGVRLETILGAILLTTGAVTAVSLQQFVLYMTGSSIRALVAVALYLVEPALYVEHTAGVGLNFFFYEQLLQPLLMLLAWALARWHASRSMVAAAASVALVATVVNFRSLFHPLLFGAPLVLVVILGTRDTPVRWRAAALVSAALLLFAWPAKNLYLFGAFTNSTWDAYGLSKGFVATPRELEPFLGRGIAPDGTGLLEGFPRLSPFGSEALHVVTAATKTGGSPNWNHLLFVTTRARLLRRVLSARRDVANDMAVAARMYARSTRAMYLHPYGDFAFGLSPAQFGGWLWLYDRVIYGDVAPLLARLRIETGLPVSLFGLIWFPALMVGALVRAYRVPGERLTLLAVLFLVLLPLVIVCATDGDEGNRMRYSTFPLVAALACVIVGRRENAVVSPRSMAWR